MWRDGLWGSKTLNVTRKAGRQSGLSNPKGQETTWEIDRKASDAFPSNAAGWKHVSCACPESKEKSLGTTWWWLNQAATMLESHWPRAASDMIGAAGVVRYALDEMESSPRGSQSGCWLVLFLAQALAEGAPHVVIRGRSDSGHHLLEEGGSHRRAMRRLAGNNMRGVTGRPRCSWRCSSRCRRRKAAICHPFTHGVLAQHYAFLRHDGVNTVPLLHRYYPDAALKRVDSVD
ncbi:hypothetical protein BU16DRAFT_561138 [Lophium mytilinum]|uniref:Uncharacterized protein n=1 Tax=Lophium mytilinum TaxID=390894 RepID=A0A6A6QWW9_9PEZI|nr:hypothetical protein BU16DRAFT_561138 [Lophium mytilinum]